MGSPALAFCFLAESFGSRASRISAFIKTQALALKVTERSMKMRLSEDSKLAKLSNACRKFGSNLVSGSQGEIDVVVEFVRKFALECCADG